jgi:hypothetical protein
MILLEKTGLFLEEREEKREKQRRRERPDAQKAAEAFILLKSIQERARTIRPTPYKLTSNIHCVLNKVCFYWMFLYSFMRLRKCSFNPQTLRCCAFVKSMVLVVEVANIDFASRQADPEHGRWRL